MRDLAGDPLFLEPGLDWRPVSPKLISERRVVVVVPVVVGIGLVAIGLMADAVRTVFLILGLVMLALCAAVWFVVIPRFATSWRYAERDADLLVRRGRLIRRLTVVPYGRMQVIQVTSNPIATRLGIAKVTLVTASADTDARIPGLPTQIAHDLRDRLAAKGEASSAGL